MTLVRPCLSQGCPALVPVGESRCDRHAGAKDEGRKTRQERGYTNQWLKESRAFLDENPLCVECKAKGKLIRAECTDHITPHKGNETLFWDRNNWQPLCHECHSAKTAREDGGFGHRRK